MNSVIDSPVYQYILRPLRSNPTLGMCVATGGLSVCTYWWYARSIRLTLRETQEKCLSIAEEAFKQCRAELKVLEDGWANDLKVRDASVRRLELQNVEQTRSIARLDAAMKLCLANPGPQVPE